MGVKDLIKHLDGGLHWRNIFVDCRGQTVAIDTHVWLHEIAGMSTPGAAGSGCP